jgi:DNA polymerase
MADGGMGELEALRLMLEWGADEALLDSPVDRFAPTARPVPPHPAPSAVPSGAHSPLAPSAALVSPRAAGPAQAEQAASAAAAATDLAILHQIIDGFTACPLRATASHTIAPSGNPAAGLLFVYDNPGPDDDRAGRAFSGPSGARLDRVLGSAGLDRTRFLVAPLLPWRTPGGRPASDAEVALCLPFLHRVVALVRPRRLVVLGAGPYRALGGDENGFRKARGKWALHAIPGLDAPIPVLPMLSAELWLSSAASRQATWADLLQLMAALQDAD